MVPRDCRALVQQVTEALRRKDPAALEQLYSHDAVAFDLAPPLVRRGAASIRQRAEEWFAGFEGPIRCDVTELVVHESGDVAFHSSLNHIQGTQKSGGSVDMWIRVTSGARKIDGAWRVVHEHVSVPFDMQSFKARLDLRPDKSSSPAS